MTKQAEWFSVDRKGLADLVERKGKAFILAELVQNAWDENVTEVRITLRKDPSRSGGRWYLSIEDDSPDGFRDLRDTYTLFAPSYKKADIGKRGRFNLGEKLVLAICDEAVISSTTGTVSFDKNGRAFRTSRKLSSGSQVSLWLRLTGREADEIRSYFRRLIPPPGVATTLDGELLPERIPVVTFPMVLVTEESNDEGILRRVYRKTEVRLYDPQPGEEPSIYEMGIPVVESGDRWHYDVGQKVPLNMDRDNVPPSYLRALRTEAVNQTVNLIDKDDSTSSWVKEAMRDERIVPDAVRKVVELRFGDKVVAYDPSDPEANKVAAAEGYSVISGGAFSKEEWENVRNAGVVKPAGQVTPSNAMIEASADGEPPIPEEEWTPAMRRMADYAKRFADQVLYFQIRVEFYSSIHIQAAAWYGGRRMAFNLGKLGRRFVDFPDQVAVDELLIHELGHEYALDHLSSDYYDALCKVGALAKLRGGGLVI